jgi:hypothetical protein
MTLSCRRCGENITFDDHHVSADSGKKILLDYDTDKPHICNSSNSSNINDSSSTSRGLKKTFKTECGKCGKTIWFDDNIVSRNAKRIPQDDSGNHQCGSGVEEQPLYIIKCHDCKKEIMFDDRYLSKKGKKIPLEQDDSGKLRPHKCPVSKAILCRQCGVAIIFDPENKSLSGKMIPLLASTREPHSCNQ